jgi:hypothetical protein
VSGLLTLPRAAIAIVIAVLLATVLVQRAQGQADKAALTTAAARFNEFAADVRANTATAHAADQAHARRVEAAQSAVTQGATRDLETQLADARRVAADYARRLRAEAAQAHPGGGGTANLPAAAIPARPAAGAGGAALLDEDIRICTENTVKAEAWPAWWAKQQEIVR